MRVRHELTRPLLARVDIGALAARHGANAVSLFAALSDGGVVADVIAEDFARAVGASVYALFAPDFPTPHSTTSNGNARAYSRAATTTTTRPAMPAGRPTMYDAVRYHAIADAKQALAQAVNRPPTTMGVQTTTMPGSPGEYVHRGRSGAVFIERDGALAQAARDLAARTSGNAYDYISAHIDRSVVGTPREQMFRLIEAQKLCDLALEEG